MFPVGNPDTGGSKGCDLIVMASHGRHGICTLVLGSETVKVSRIAQVLEKQFPEVAERQPEFLAQHYTEAGLAEQAIPYGQRAGQRAIERSATSEAGSV